jgi:bifunctional DNase/RNase
MSDMVEVSVSRLGLDGSTNSYVVILKEREGERILPIWIGQPEAESILLEMNGVRKERPLTHDLCKSLIVGLGAELARVHITKVEDRTYYAELHLVRGQEVFQIDARPSDSIAIALRTGSSVFAEDALLLEPPEEEEVAESDVVTPPSVELAPNTGELSAEQLKQYLSSLRPEDFGKFQP